MIPRNILYIVGGVVVLAIVGFVGTRFIPGMNGGNYQQNLNGTQTYSNNEGSVTVGTGAGMPSDWPNDVPANYTGAQIIFSGNSNPETGSSGSAVSYTLQGVSAQEVASYYQSGLTSNGWTVEGIANLGTQTVIGANKGERTFGVSIADGGNGMLTITAGVGL